MNKTQAGRLLTLAWFLKTEVKRKEFSMQSFWRWRKRASDGGCVPDLKKHRCNTSACAIGWCSVVFPSRFRLNTCWDFSFDGEDCCYDGWEIQDFFGIRMSEAEYLFSSNYVRTPKQEAAAIEYLVGQYGWTYACA